MHKRAEEEFDRQAMNVVVLFLGGCAALFVLGLVAYIVTA